MKDQDIRSAIKSDLLLDFKNDAESIILDEVGVNCGFSRIDIAVINGAFHGYEIKSEKDDLRRLQSQLHNYDRVFDFLYLVTSEKHHYKLAEILPEHVGILVASVSEVPHESSILFSTHRIALRNPNIDAFSLAQLLWRDECLDVLSEYDLIQGFRQKRKWLLWEKIATSFTLSELSSIVRARLKKRYKELTLLNESSRCDDLSLP